MTEREYLREYGKKMIDRYEDLYWYKIPDVPMSTHKKPFDAICIYEGIVYCIEAKIAGGKIAPHQEAALWQAGRAGAIPVVIIFHPRRRAEAILWRLGKDIFLKKF